MSSKCRIGMLTPSLNRALEPITSAMLRDMHGVTAHFSRLRVTHVGLDQSSADQFSNESFLRAASLLADAKVDVIAWNGTSGSWMGIDWERRLCAAIAAETGVPTTGSTLALLDAFQRFGVKRYSLAVPYVRDHTEKIIDVFAGQGLECVASDYMDIRSGESIADIPENKLLEQLSRLATPDSQGIAVVCTNVAAAPYVEEMEMRLKVPIFDSIAVTLWKCLELGGIEPRISGWGKLLRGDYPTTVMG